MTSEILFGPALDPRLSYRIPVLHVASDGTRFAFCEARLGDGGDWQPMYLQMRRQRPGQRWEAPVNLAFNPRGPAHNPAAFEAEGALHLLYGLDYGRFFQIASRDGGDTFSAPEEITYVFEALRPLCDWHCIAVGPGGVCRLASGRIVAPVWLGGLRDPRQHSPAQAATIYSDDEGKTWQPGTLLDLFEHGPSEAQIIAIPGGALVSLRNDDPRRLRMFARSRDGAHWDKPAFAETVTEINCQGSLLRLGERLFISGPEPLNATAVAPRRERLVLRMSDDWGATWPKGKVLVAGTAGYSALAPAADGGLMCLYETWEDPRHLRQVLLTLSADEL